MLNSKNNEITGILSLFNRDATLLLPSLDLNAELLLQLLLNNVNELLGGTEPE